MGTRPRLACEVCAEGVVAARAEDASAVLLAISRVELAEEIAVPRLHSVDAAGAADNSIATVASSGVGGSAEGRATVVSAVRKALEAVFLRSREVTLIVPDASLRVLLLDFDELPAKPSEALPVVRFRLKKLLPFDADDAAVSYQVMATSKSNLQVLAVAMPRALLADYESVVREAGFEPGAVLPSTLAALAGLDEHEAPALVVNAGREGVTTAIVKAGVLLLHRTVDLGTDLQFELRSNDVAAANDAAILAQEIQEEIAREAAYAIAAEDNIAETTSEVAQAVSVAAAYFEDTLETPPPVVHTAGTLGATALTALLDRAHIGPLAVQEIVQPEMLAAEANLSGTADAAPFGWLAGVRGALAN